MNHLARTMAIITGLGEYYDKNLSKNQIVMYSKDLQDLSPEDLERAVNLYTKDPRNDRFPLPAKLRSMVDASQSPEDVGRDVASRILEAVSLFGWNNGDKAKDALGPLGWLVVQRQGGWFQLCSEIDERNRSIIQAQLRDLAATLSRKDSSGTLHQMPGLSPPKTEHGGELKGMGSVIKLIADRKPEP